MKPVAAARSQLLKEIFPSGVPVLWCPPLTHYDVDGNIDEQRIAAHLAYLAPHVKTFLIPGSTGDAWELSEQETSQLLDIALEQAQKLDVQILIGALKPDASEALDIIQKTVERLKARTREPDARRALREARVCGFAVCGPRGKELGQEEIERGLTSILELDLPTAIYQLPQVTQNEIGPELAAGLAARFENFILFKDSSGADRVLLSGNNLDCVCALRGAEGEYTRWIKTGGGPYHGFLLASANSFAAEFSKIFSGIAAGRSDEPQQLSKRISAAVAAVSQLVTGLPAGNPFANANKALDHFFAYGPCGVDAPLPRIHSGGQLPVEAIRATSEVLVRHGLMPAKGYLE